MTRMLFLALAAIAWGDKAYSDPGALNVYKSDPSVAAAATAKAPILTTAAAIKQAWLAQSNPNLVSPLDRDAVRRRSVLAQRAWRIQSGLLDVVFQYQAHLKNSEAYRAAGDDANAAQEMSFAVGLSAAAQNALSNEYATFSMNLEEAKATSQAGARRR